jgi:hypothetical protein
VSKERSARSELHIDWRKMTEAHHTMRWSLLSCVTSSHA